MENFKSKMAGFSLIELLISMTILLLILGIVSTVTYRAVGIQSRERQTADALTSAQAALSVMSRELSNSGFGLYENADTKIANNGIVIADSGAHRIRFRANLDNSGGVPGSPASSTLVINALGEDVTYFFDPATSCILRHDLNGGGVGIPETSIVVNRISNVTFQYFDYVVGSAAPAGPSSTPTVDTSRVHITVEVTLDPVAGQPNNQHVTLGSDVTIRNSGYMLLQY